MGGILAHTNSNIFFATVAQTSTVFGISLKNTQTHTHTYMQTYTRTHTYAHTHTHTHTHTKMEQCGDRTWGSGGGILVLTNPNTIFAAVDHTSMVFL